MIKELEDIFTYKGGNDLPEGAVRLSGSTFSSWVSTPWKFYQEQILGNKEFKGSTSSVLGICCHLAAECYEKRISHVQGEVEAQLHNYSYDNPELELDVEEIIHQFPLMVKALVEGYLHSAPKAVAVEEELSIDLGDNLYAQGSVDRHEAGMVVDYKTFNSATDPKAIPSYYKQQLLFYAWMYRKLGVEVDRIRLVYISREIDTRRTSEKTGKPIGKITPSRVVVLTEMITDEDIEWVNSMINLWVDSMKLIKEHPEYTYMVFHDNRIKEK